VRYILLRDAVKLPFRRDDLTKEKKILSEYKKAAGLIIQEAAERIFEIYRMTLTEVEGKSISSFS
jgi:hypothetical protein